jgi:RHS repeat-associated protein
MGTAANGAASEDYLYYPWGQEWTVAGTATEYHFAGFEWHDSPANLEPALFRNYASTEGRWLSPDPLGGDVTNPQSLDRYAYVTNNPTTFTDPLGLDATGCTQATMADGTQGYGCSGPDSVTVVASAGGMSLGGGLGGDVPPPYLIFRPGWGAGGGSGGGSGGGIGHGGSGNGSGGFLSGLKDIFLDFLARNANYLPGVCTAGGFLFGTGGGGNASGGVEGGALIDKHIGSPTAVEPLGEASYGPIGVGVTPSEELVFVQPAPKVPVGAVFAADPQNGFINNSGISIGFFAGRFGHGKGLAGGFGGGAYLTFSSAANCVKNF